MAETTFLNPLTGKRETAQKVSSVSSYGVSTPEKSKQTYTIKTKDKQYTIGQKTLDWIRGRYKQSFDGYYGFDDEDQYNKANGIMPRSFQNGYGNNDWDRQLLELGLPSSKYLDQYLEDYHAWYGDGQYLKFDKNQSEYIKTQAQKGWDYSDSVEDMRRQARGIMPVKEEAKYKDKNGNFLSYADEMYFSMGLPPTSELGAHINSLNDYSNKLSRVDEFYTAAANNAVENLLLKGIKNDDTLYEQEDGTKVKGSDLWRTSYYSFINGSDDWSDIRSWVQPDDEQAFKPDVSWSIDKTEEERMAWEARQREAAAKADDPYRIDPSYNDFLDFFDDNADSVYTQKVANESVAKVFGTVGEVIDDAHNQQVSAMYAGITDEETLTAVLKARAADDPAQVIRDLKEYDVPKRLIRKAKNQLLDSNADEAVKQSIKDAFNEPKIINVSELEKTTADGLFKKDATDALGKQIEKDYDDKQYVELGQHKAYSIFKNALEIDENGVVSADSVSAAVQELAAMGASPRFIENVAAGVVNQNALLLGDGIQQQGASELMETVRQAVDEADRASRKKHLEAYRVAAKEQGVTDFEFDQMVRRMAWDDTLDDETAARNYYATKGIIWDALNSEEKIELVQTFTDTKMVNKEIDKNAAQVVGDYVGGRWLQTLSLGIASGTVGLADMVAGLGSTREQWEITKTLSDAYQWSAAYGKSDQSLGFKALNIGTTVANELIRMSTIGAAGRAVAGSKFVSNLNRTADYAGLFAKTSVGMDKAVFGATKLFNRGLAALIKGSAHTTTQLVANAIGNNFAQAMSYTDENGNPPSRKDATLYAVVTGAFEGAVEALAMDKWSSKALGSSKLAKTVMKGGKSLSSVSLDKKARLIHLAASALGEFGEEAGSYALSCFMQRQTYNENAEFDAREFVESGMMGALIGFTGAAMSAGSYNASNIVYEYMSNHGYDTDFFDLMHASVQVEALPQKMYDQYSQTNEWLTHDDYVSVQRDLVSHARQMESSKQNYYAAQKKINAETQLKIDAVSRLEAQLASLQGAPMSVETVNEIGNVMKALSVAKSELSLEQAQATQKLSDLQSGYKETTAQHRAAMEKAQAKLDAHNVALYNTFLPDIARLKGLSAAEVQRTTAEAQERNANAILSEKYRSQEFYEGLFDEMDAASDDAALAYSNLAAAAATIEQNSKLVNDMKEKLLSMRVSAEIVAADTTAAEWEGSEVVQYDKVKAALDEYRSVRKGSSDVKIASEMASRRHTVGSAAPSGMAEMLRDKIMPTLDAVYMSIDEVQERIDIATSNGMADIANFWFSVYDAKRAPERTQRAANKAASTANQESAQKASELNSALESAASAYEQASVEQAPVESPAAEHVAAQQEDAVHAAPVNLVALDDASVKRIVALGKKLGRTVVVEDLPEGVYGRYDGDGILHINRKQLSNGDSPELIVFKHELTHSLESSSRYYDRLKAFVKQYARDSFVANEYFQTFEEQYNSFAEQVRRNRAALGEETTDAIVEHEFVAAFAQDRLFTDEAAINKLAQTNATLASRIINHIRYWLHNNLGVGKTGNAEADDLRQIERLYAMALHNAGVKPSDDVREYMIGSTLGRTRAEQLGYDIYKFDGADGFERFFFSDNFDAEGNADVTFNYDKFIKYKSLLLGGYKKFTLPDVLDHPRLYAIYPELRDVAITYGSLFQGTPKKGSHDASKNEITIYSDGASSQDQFEETLLHEVQHAVQAIERSNGYKMASGSNYKAAQAYVAANDLSDLAAAVSEGTVSRDEAVSKAARLLDDLYHYKRDGEIRDAYKSDLGETEARTTGESRISEKYGETSEEYSAERAESIHDYYPPVVSGDAQASFSSIASSLDVLFEGGLTSLREAAQNNTITKDEAVILDVANKAEDMVSTRTVAVPNTSVQVDSLSSDSVEVSKDRARSREEGRGTSPLQQASGFVQQRTNDATTVSKHSGLSADNGAFSASWEGYLAPDMTTPEYSTGLSWDNLGRQYGVHEQGGGNRVRSSSVPLSTDGDNRTSKFARTFEESPQLDSQRVEDFHDEVVNGLGTYDPQSNETLQQEAEDDIVKAGGIGKAHDVFKQRISSGEINDTTITMGMNLLSEASARGDWDAQVDIITDLCIAATESGRAVQAFSMLKKMGAAGAVYYMQKIETRLNAKYADEIASGKMDRIQIPPDLMNNLANAKNVYEIEAAEEEISAYIGQNLYVPFSQRLQNWRYFSMLANPTTHIRNIVGNALMYGARSSKNAIAASLESAFVSQENRTHAVYSKANHRAELAAAEQAWKEHERDLTASGGKYGIDQEINKNMRRSNIGVIDKLMNKNYEWMGDEDKWFLRATYIDAYTQYLVAQGIDPANITEEQDAAAHKVADTEARTATFRDASAVADWLNSVKNPALKVVVEGAIPFKKTPINVAKRGIEYSPAGLIKGVYMAANIMAKGDGSKYSASQAVDRIASGTTGTALSLIGFFLAKAGILRGTGDEDKDIEKFLSATGDKNYSLNFSVGEKEYALDLSGVAPINIPLFLGVAAYEAMERESDEKVSLSDFTALISGIADPLMEMSFLSSLDSALTAYNNEDGVGGSVGAVAWNAVKSYGTQLVPALGSKLADFADPTQRTSAGDATSVLGADASQFGKSLLMKVPAATFALEPKIDVHGDKNVSRTIGDFALDFANAFILPARITAKNRDAIDKELVALAARTGSATFLPVAKTQKKLTYKDTPYFMNDRQFTAYQRDMGEQVYAAIKRVMSSSAWSSMPDEQKVELLEDAKADAEKAVREKYLDILGAYDN